MNQIKQHIHNITIEALEILNIQSDIQVIVDCQPLFGDFSINIAMKLAGVLKEKPMKIAEKIVHQMDQLKAEYVEKIEIVSPGFINFYLSDIFLLNEVATYQPFKATNKTMVVEYMQPNTNKPLHVGHLRNAVLGSSLIAILRAVGHTVKAATINNDRGLHITKSMWSYLYLGRVEQITSNPDWQSLLSEWTNLPNNWIQPSKMSDQRLRKGDHFVGHWYILGDQAYESDEKVKIDMQEMLLAWENKSSPQHNHVRKLWEQMNSWFYEGMRKTYAKLGVEFDNDQISYESAIYEAGKNIILENIENGKFTRLEDGAVMANLEDTYALPNKILLRKDGTGIYMTFDIELTRQRSLQSVSKLIWVVGSDQELYFKQLFAVCDILGFGKQSDFYHFSYGMVKLPEGKMSSRKGTVVYADDVLSESIQKAAVVMDTAGIAKNLDPREKENAIIQIGLGAVKYTMLSYDPKSELVFDLDKSVTFEGSSGPYLQYSLARALNILKKTKKNVKPILDTTALSQSEHNLLHQLAKFDIILLKAANDFSPHHLATYLVTLAQDFNTMYAKCNPIIGNSRLEHLTYIFSLRMKQGLELMKITPLEQM